MVAPQDTSPAGFTHPQDLRNAYIAGMDDAMQHCPCQPRDWYGAAQVTRYRAGFQEKTRRMAAAAQQRQAQQKRNMQASAAIWEKASSAEKDIFEALRCADRRGIHIVFST